MKNKPTMIQKPQKKWGAKEWDTYIHEAQFMENILKNSQLNKIYTELLAELEQREKDYAAWACVKDE